MMPAITFLVGVFVGFVIGSVVQWVISLDREFRR